MLYPNARAHAEIAIGSCAQFQRCPILSTSMVFRRKTCPGRVTVETANILCDGGRNKACDSQHQESTCNRDFIASDPKRRGHAKEEFDVGWGEELGKKLKLSPPSQYDPHEPAKKHDQAKATPSDNQTEDHIENDFVLQAPGNANDCIFRGKQDDPFRNFQKRGHGAMARQQQQCQSQAECSPINGGICE